MPSAVSGLVRLGDVYVKASWVLGFCGDCLWQRAIAWVGVYRRVQAWLGLCHRAYVWMAANGCWRVHGLADAG